MAKSDDERYKDRLQAIEWAREVLADPATVILDVETAAFHDTDLPDDDPAKYDVEICEIGVVAADGGALYDTLVGTACAITPEATAVHGIHPLAVESAEAFHERAYADLAALLEGRRVLGYNISFDRGVLKRAVAYSNGGDLEAAERWMARARWEDVMLPYSQWIGDWDEARGEYRWQRQPGSGHRALADTYTTLGLLHTMAKADPGWQPPLPGRRGRPRSAPQPASDKQVKFVNSLLSRHGVTKGDDRHRVLSRIVDRPIASSTELTSPEASSVIDALKDDPQRWIG
ncbi:3'-5' exonuclease [Spirillospora sp. NPDC050679]